MKNTFAERAQKISKKYPYANSVPSDREARDSELKVLYNEQEEYKQGQVQLEEERLANPIFSTEDETLFARGGGTSNPTDDIVKYSQENMKNDEVQGKKGLFNNLFTNLFGEGDGESLDTYLNIGSGLSAMGTNLINRNSVKDPKLITPTQYKPTTKFRGVDLDPIARNFQNQLDSSKYQLTESGADFDTLSAGITKVNDQLSGKYGQVKVEESLANNAEGARVEGVVNEAGKINTQNMNQAKIDQAQRQDIADQKRRDYLAALGENLQGIFSDESDRAYSKELAPLLDNIAKLNAIKTT